MLAIVLHDHRGLDSIGPNHQQPMPEPTAGEVLVRVAAAGVTPLEHTIATGAMPLAAPPPLVLGNEAAGIIAESSDPRWNVADRVMFTGPYGLFKHGTWAEYIAVETAHLARVPSDVPLSTAAGMPVAYLTAVLALQQAGFREGMSVLAPGIGGSVGNATYQVAKALGASTVLSTAGTTAKTQTATAAGFNNIIDLTNVPHGGLAESIAHHTEGRGVDIIIDGLGGTVAAEALGGLTFGGSLVTLGYSAGRQSLITLTDLIWKAAKVQGFSLLLHSPEQIAHAYAVIENLLQSGQLAPQISRILPLSSAVTALQYLVKERPFGKVVLTVDEASSS